MVCRAREEQRRLPVRLDVSGLPCGLVGPVQLLALEPDGGQPTVRVREDCFGPTPQIAEVSIPLIAWVRDAAGCTHCGRTEAVVCVSLPRGCCRGPGTFCAEASVRLVESECSCTSVFEACVSVRVEVYMVRMEPASCGSDRGCPCPRPSPMPMYPEPCC